MLTMASLLDERERERERFYKGFLSGGVVVGKGEPAGDRGLPHSWQ